MSSNQSNLGQYGSGNGTPPIERLPISYYLGLISSEYFGDNNFASVTDNFIRANENPLDTELWELSGGGFSALQIINNRCVASALSTECSEEYIGAPFGNDQSVFITLGTISNVGDSGVAAVVRQNGLDGYYADVTIPSVTGQIALVKNGGLVETTLGIYNTPLNIGDVVGLSVVGTALVVTLNGTVILAASDSFLASGTPAILIEDDAAIGDTYITNFTATSPFSSTGNSPKFNAFLYMLLNKFNDITNCQAQLDTAFDVSTAIGVQLDAVGSIVGANRTVGFQPTGGLSPVLDDDDYRIYIMAKAAMNQWSGTIDSLQMIWQTLFPSGRIVIADNQNMTANIILVGAFTPMMEQLITNGYIVPRPQAVLYNYLFGVLPAFGFDLNTGLVAGFDVGKWI